ncbi:competence protein CoiA [Lactobacillus colini]|uniref:Competence protein CoiA n=2 Tax=Lactobacillus colini TaxID=1819254 RepID=A0ABS4MD74_9LACO|nr:competence protein CoiA [Lactobacillus colini]
MLVISQEKMPFFKHISFIKGTGEKEEHQHSKQLLCASLVANGLKAEMEVPLADQQLRADVLVYPNLAFEVQCAPLSEREFKHRHFLYEKIGIKDVWIVGKRHHLKKKLKKSQKIFLKYSKTWDWYYLEVDASKETICLKYQIRLEPLIDNIVCKRKTFSLSEDGIKELFAFRPDSTIKIKINSQKQRNYLIRQLRQKTSFGRKVAASMYELSITIDDLPAEIFNHVRLPKEELTINKFFNHRSNK